MSGAFGVQLDSRDAALHAASARALARVFLPRYYVVGSGLATDDARAAQRRIDRLVDACGCGEGAGMTMVAAVAYIAYAAGPGAWPGAFGVAWRCLAAMFLGATVGKCLGLVRARLQLRRELLALAALLPPAADAYVVPTSADDVLASVFAP